MDGTKACPSCGAENRRGVTFCVRCGTRMPDATGPVPGTPVGGVPPTRTPSDAGVGPTRGPSEPGPPPTRGPAETAGPPAGAGAEQPAYGAAAGRPGDGWTDPGTRPSGDSRRTFVAVAVTLVIALFAGAFGYFVFLADEAEANVVVYEPPLAPGDAPFTDPVDVPADDVGAEIPTPAPELVEQGADARIGSGPFGGSGSNTVCDRELLISSLRAQRDRLAEWLRVLGVREADFEEFVRGLRPVTLAVDTRVTNHSFEGGVAIAFQSILPAGTAVLVDAGNRPVVRCRCGNPLLEAVRVGTASCKGCPSGYTPPSPLPPGAPAIVVVVINPPPARGEPQATPTPPPPTPTPEPTPPPEARNLSIGARASASSTFSGEFPASLSVDGRTSTSWFSSGPGAGGTTTYTISLPQPSTVTRLEYVGNENHSNPSFRRGFGFRNWTITLLDGGGNTLATVNSAGSGTTSQNHDVGAVEGVVQVRLVASGHEDPTCGGFSELRVIGY